jgi:hypothetical protein
MCPAGITNVCTGKEGYPTLAFEATVDHSMRFIATTKSFFGSQNDKTIVKFDTFIQDLRQGNIYSYIYIYIYTCIYT